jgi:hypothetical protein
MHPGSSSCCSSEGAAGCSNSSLPDLTIRIPAHSNESSHRAGSSSSSTSSPRLLHCMPACSEEVQSSSLSAGEHPALPLLVVHAGEASCLTLTVLE